MKATIQFTTLLLFTLLISCKDSENIAKCGTAAIVNSEFYRSGPNDKIFINNARIEEDCLYIEIGASGCSGDSWEINLYATEEILESFPPQRNMRLSLKNDEMCQAFFTRELIFDISNLKTNGSELQLNLTDFEDSLLYKY